MGSLGGWKELKGVTNVRYENGALMADATTKDPGVWIDTGVSIKASDVQMVKVTTMTENGRQGQLFYQTDIDPDMGVNGKRFDVQQGSSNWEEREGFPANRDKLQGNITAVRWDPINAADIKFGIKKIQFWGYPTEEVVNVAPISLMFNGSKIKSTRPPFIKDGVTYVAIARPLHEMKLFKTKYDHIQGKYTIEYDKDSIAVMTVGSNIMKVNSVDIDLGAPCYYEDGNLFVPLRSTFEALGTTVEWIGEENAINIKKVDTSDTYSYLDKRDESKPFSLFNAY